MGRLKALMKIFSVGMVARENSRKAKRVYEVECSGSGPEGDS